MSVMKTIHCLPRLYFHRLWLRSGRRTVPEAIVISFSIDAWGITIVSRYQRSWQGPGHLSRGLTHGVVLNQVLTQLEYHTMID
jgi:hypothetical protein